MKTIKDWDKILYEISSGEESDEHDTPNIVSLKKHGSKLMEIVSNIVEKKEIPENLQGANKKAIRNTLSEPAMESFKYINQEIKHTIEESAKKRWKSQSPKVSDSKSAQPSTQPNTQSSSQQSTQQKL